MAGEVTIVEGPPPPPPPTPTKEIHVSPGGEMQDFTPLDDAPKPGSAKARMFEALRAKAKDPGATPEPPRTNRPGAPEPKEEEQELPAEETPEAKAQVPEGQKPPVEGDKKRVNPWKLVDNYKGQVANLQKEISDLRTSALPAKEREEFEAKLHVMEERNKALENHMGFMDYSKTKDFQEKYQQPYENAWMRAMTELKELYVPTEDGNRAFTPEDLLQLVNLPLDKARAVSDELYGPYSNDVMGFRKEIRQLFDSQERALNDAKTNGASKMKEHFANQQKLAGQIGQFVKETWNNVNESILRDETYGHYFTPTESDPDANQRLAKGFELVDRAFNENPSDPRLSTEERRAIIKRHAAVRNRAAAFGRLVYDLKKASDEVAELKKELSRYRGSEPPTGGTPRSGAAPAGPTNAHEEVFGALRKLAK
jgi:hypothetical protein